jgi:PIN domain nuclease of toxin-antitoxin system
LTDPAHDRLVSIATIWEIGIKVAIGKLPLSKPFRAWMDKALTDLAVSVLPVTLDHVERQTQLEFHHRDPFDRLLIAQALVEDIPLISGDAQFDAYGVKRIWT